MGSSVLPAHVILRRNPRCTRLRLSIDYRLRKAVLSAPPAAGFSDIRGFLDRSHSWIEARLKNLPPKGTELREISIEGVPYKIVSDARVHISDETREVKLPLEEPHAKDLLLRALKKRAGEKILSHCQAFSQALGVRFKKITLRETKSRWGSCSSEGNLNFSWRLILAPSDVLAYVCAHEVAHLKEMNHSPRFWRHVETLNPDYRRQIIWLKKNGPTLQAAL